MRADDSMKTILRYAQFLSLALWVGSIFCFGFILAPALFAILPNVDMAGAVVAVTLPNVHWLGIVCGAFYLAATVALSRSFRGIAGPGALAVIAMVALTLVSQLAVFPRMDSLRARMMTIAGAPVTGPMRKKFNHLHVASVSLEGAVFLLGLATLFLFVQERSR